MSVMQRCASNEQEVKLNKELEESLVELQKPLMLPLLVLFCLKMLINGICVAFGLLDNTMDIEYLPVQACIVVTFIASYLALKYYPRILLPLQFFASALICFFFILMGVRTAECMVPQKMAWEINDFLDYFLVLCVFYFPFRSPTKVFAGMILLFSGTLIAFIVTKAPEQSQDYWPFVPQYFVLGGMLTFFIRYIITLAFKRQKEAEHSEANMTIIFDSLPDAILLISEIDSKQVSSSVSAGLIKNNAQEADSFNSSGRKDRSHLYRADANPGTV